MYEHNVDNFIDDVSFRYCSGCLKKFSLAPEQIQSERVRLFLPTIDLLQRSYFAYIEVSRTLIEQAFASSAPFSIDLTHEGRILHVEVGEYPSAEREMEIIEFYDHELRLEHKAHSRLAS